MGCLWSKGIIKHDEVSPLGINFIRKNSRPTTSNGQTGKPAPNLPHAQHETATPLPQQQVVLTKGTHPSRPSPNQNGRTALASQDGGGSSAAYSAPAANHEREKVSDINENDASTEREKVSDVNENDTTTKSLEVEDLNGQNDAGNLTNGKAADISTVSSFTNEIQGYGDSEEGVAADPTNENGGTSSAYENDAAQSAEQTPEAAAVPFQMPEVTIERVPDAEGCPITLGKFFGVWTAPWPSLPEQVMRAQLFTFDDSDVVLTGYPKSGSHWMWEMVQMLMTGRAEHCRTPKERLMFSFGTQQFFDTLPPPRVFNTHAPFQGFPAALREGRNKCKMIYLLRNPKDVAVSFYHHLISQVDFDYEGTFHGYLDLFMEGKVPAPGSWFDYVLGWEQTLEQNPDLPVLVLYYEDVKEDTVSALRRVNEFLGLNRDPDLLSRVADQCAISKMKKVDEELKERGPDYVNLSKTGKPFLLRKGEVGDWQNWFSPEDDRRFMGVVSEKLRRSKLTFRYLLDHNEKGAQKEEKEKKEEKEEKEEEEEEEEVESTWM